MLLSAVCAIRTTIIQYLLVFFSVSCGEWAMLKVTNVIYRVKVEQSTWKIDARLRLGCFGMTVAGKMLDCAKLLINNRTDKYHWNRCWFQYFNRIYWLLANGKISFHCWHSRYNPTGDRIFSYDFFRLSAWRMLIYIGLYICIAL